MLGFWGGCPYLWNMRVCMHALVYMYGVHTWRPEIKHSCHSSGAKQIFYGTLFFSATWGTHTMVGWLAGQ